ncbi:LysR family transcriptional regulator [Aliivibrio kagoshimensis]|uniref:LysR family transcriptional regulator n=1 Tax=Aliivibrio kagoshimensis TaxID=2910230 RepID=UPI003D0F775E
MFFEKLARVDLNLLVCLQVLLEECNVTYAAKRLNLSQSSVSKNLAKLRQQFNDPLFTRTAYGLNPTARAKELQLRLQPLLHELESFTRPVTFDPSLSTRRFKMSLVESTYTLILPAFLSDILTQSPHSMLDTHAWDNSTFSKLQSGEFDLGITGKDIHPNDAQLTMQQPKDIFSQEIYRDHQVCLVRKDHPILNQPWNLNAYLSLRHIQVRCVGNDRWLLDYKLADMNLERDIAVIVPDFNSAASLANHSDLIFTAPSHFMKVMAKQLDMVVLELPTDLPSMAYTLFWHEHNQEDPANLWLRNIIITRCNKLFFN